ncbi:MAG: hypothetical protein HY608_00485 [Planctomycetes bacterium]|nr:hypothetical protein [Planctomycetota bacterium]
MQNVPGTRRTRLRRLAWGALAAVLALGAIEAVLRVMVRVAGYNLFAEATVDDPELDWRLNPGYRGPGTTINRAGFRGPDLPGEGARRLVAALGDSCTFGTGVTDAEAWPAALERLLGPPWAVANAGVPGYTSSQCLRRLERDVLPLHPEGVVIKVLWNDLWTYRNAGANTAASPRARAVSRALSRSLAFTLLRDRVVNPLRARPAADPALAPEPGADPAAALALYRRNLDAMIALARRSGAWVVVLGPGSAPPEADLPLTPSWGEGRERFDDLRRRFLGEAREAASAGGAPFLEPEDLLPGGPGGIDFLDAVHRNAAGHLRVAEALARWIGNLSTGNGTR